MSASRKSPFGRFRDRFREQLAWTRFRYRLRRESARRQDVIVLQSSDQYLAPLLEVTSDANRRYTERMNHAYAQFVGNIAPRPFTANFNRYYLLREVVAHTSHQWALWMDADAIVVDPTVPIEPIIDADCDKLIIACRGQNAGQYDINNGVFFFNLRHRETVPFLRYLIMAAEHVRPDNSRFRSDQRHVQAWLRRRMRLDGSIAQVKRYAGPDSDKFNYKGPFIQHVLRRWGSYDQRLHRLENLRTESKARMLAAEKNASGVNYTG